MNTNTLTQTYNEALETKMRSTGTAQQIAVVEKVMAKYNCEWAVAIDLMQLATKFNRRIDTFVNTDSQQGHN